MFLIFICLFPIIYFVSCHFFNVCVYFNCFNSFIDYLNCLLIIGVSILLGCVCVRFILLTSSCWFVWMFKCLTRLCFGPRSSTCLKQFILLSLIVFHSLLCVCMCVRFIFVNFITLICVNYVRVNFCLHVCVCLFNIIFWLFKCF